MILLAHVLGAAEEKGRKQGKKALRSRSGTNGYSGSMMDEFSSGRPVIPTVVLVHVPRFTTGFRS